MMNSSTMNFPALKFSTPKPKGTFQSNTFQPWTFQQWTNVQKIIVEKFIFEKSRVEKFLFAFGLKSWWLKSPGLKSSWLKFMWLKTSRSKCPSTTTWPQSKTSHLKKKSLLLFSVCLIQQSTYFILKKKYDWKYLIEVSCYWPGNIQTTQQSRSDKMQRSLPLMGLLP